MPGNTSNAPALLKLPVSGLRILLNPLTGWEDLLLFETRIEDVRLGLALAQRITQPAEANSADKTEFDWQLLTPTDLDFVLIRLRQSILGENVTSDVTCNAEGCGQRVDISFGIEPYLAHSLPRRSTESAAVMGWQRMEDSDSQYRLPTITDLIAVEGLPDSQAELALRCIRPGDITAARRNEIEAVIEARAPSLSQELQGQCPECGSHVTAFFDVRRYCLRELKYRAEYVYKDVDLLARRYHWSEVDILSLPSSRRLSYAALARSESAS